MRLDVTPWCAVAEPLPSVTGLPAETSLHDDDAGRPQPLSRDDGSDQWRQAAYRNVPILIQFDDGKTRWPDTGGGLGTSSASKPELVLGMLTALDVHDGHTALEIGTGTGYNAALLAARLGAPHVITVEIDPVLAERASSVACREPPGAGGDR
ncbi:MAG: hypothetical protein WCF33_22555 [Pseudonocardiaceae bacterium]